MAAVSATSMKFGYSATQTKQNLQATRGFSVLKFISVSGVRRSFPSLRSSRFHVSCVAKPETIEKVCEIVKKQLALPAESLLTPESKFSALGADSLDTKVTRPTLRLSLIEDDEFSCIFFQWWFSRNWVEIVMALEEKFGISVEEESSQTITTIQEASDMIEKLVEKKDG